VPGVLNSFYTIDWGTNGDGTRQEIDIEFLTYSFGSNSGRVHIALHAAGLTSFQTNPDILLDFNPSDAFHVWGFEITPTYLKWFVDNRVLYTYTYAINPITINASYQLKLNSWTAAGWINGPPVVGIESVYQIDWIKFYPYVYGIPSIPTGLRILN
jgi:beta-glucanase (GH16 family)